MGERERTVRAEGQGLLKHTFFLFNHRHTLKTKTVPLYEIIYWATYNY